MEPNFAHAVFRQLAYCAVALAPLALVPSPATAAPLDKAACAKLAQDMQNMKALDVDKLMEKGPGWAASHLPAGELSLIRQYIDLDEQMRIPLLGAGLACASEASRRRG